MATPCPAGLDCADDRSASVAPAIVPVFVLAILAVLARVYSRHLTGHSRTLSDYTIVVGLGFSASLTGLVLYSPRLGLGRHMQVVPQREIERLLISLYLGCILYAVVIAVIKISILLLYRSLFPTPGINLATRATAIVSVAWGLETALVGIFSCTPVKAFWDITVTQKKCINTTAFFIANSAVHVIIDIVILTIPVRKVWALKMTLQKKVVVCFMFLLGGFICIIGVIRLFFLATLNMADPTYSLVDTYIWSSLEANVGVICACLPTLRPLFIKLFPQGGFDHTRAATIPAAYFEYSGDHRQRGPRQNNDFARLYDYQLDHSSRSVNSNTIIHITQGVEVEQERKAGPLNLGSRVEILTKK